MDFLSAEKISERSCFVNKSNLFEKVLSFEGSNITSEFSSGSGNGDGLVILKFLWKKGHVMYL